jgi:hypothetical protein
MGLEERALQAAQKRHLARISHQGMQNRLSECGDSSPLSLAATRRGAGVSTFLTGFSLSDLPIRLRRPHIWYGRLYYGGLLMGDRKFTPNFCKIGIG